MRYPVLLNPMTQLPTTDDIHDGGVNVFYMIGGVLRLGFVQPHHDFFHRSIAQLNNTEMWAKLTKIYGWFPEERSPNGKLWVAHWLDIKINTQQTIEKNKRKIRISEDAVRTEDEVEHDVRDAYPQ